MLVNCIECTFLTLVSFDILMDILYMYYEVLFKAT